MTVAIQNLTTQTILTTTVICSLAILGTYWYQKRRKHAVPTKWRSVGKVKSLFIYPLKSGARTELETAICTEFGLQAPKSGTMYQLRDRNLQVYKEDDNKNMSHPKMVLIKTAAYDEHHFTLTAPNMQTLKVKIPSATENNNASASEFWTSEKIFTIDCGDEAAQWISKYILDSTSGLRLGYHDSLHLHRRNAMPAFKKYIPFYPNLRDEAMGMYSNLSSYLLLTQESVDDLRTKTPEPTITANNFRPSILVEDANPYAEDDWKWVKIGDVILYSVKPCTRCMQTTINPETAIRNEQNEPLRTLRKYRQLKDLKKIELDGYRTIMGNNMGLHRGGEISVGDIVYVG